MVWETLACELKGLICKTSLQIRELKLLLRIYPRALPEYLKLKNVKENTASGWSHLASAVWSRLAPGLCEFLGQFLVCMRR